MSSRWTGFFIWALVAASAAFWSLKIFAATRPVPPGAQAPQVIAANGPMERLFGAVVVPSVATAAAAPESSRFKLVGVIAPPSGVEPGGYAIVSIDDAPARTWRVGSTLDGSIALLSVSKRGAEFGPSGGPTSFSLQLPEPAPAETGSLQPATSQPDAAQLQQQIQLQQQQQRQNAPQFAQPQFPGQATVPNAMPGRGSVPRPFGRGGAPGAPNGVAPSRVGQPPEQTEAPPLQQ